MMTAAAVTTMMAERRRWLGFRARVLGFSAALLVAATAVGLVVQRAVLLRQLDNEVAASLDQERRELELLAAGRNPVTGQPFEGDVGAIFDTFLRRNVPGEGEVYLTFVDGQPYKTSRAVGDVRLDRDPRLVERWAALTVGDRGRLDTQAGRVDYLVVPLLSGGQTAGTFVVANFVQGERDEIESSIRVEAAVTGVVMLVAIGAAWVIAGRLLRPVRQLTDSARSITETDLSRRIPIEGDDEIAELARTFNEMLDRLAAAFASQRAFVDDAGHELRTPITIVRGHLELMGDDPQDRHETVALVTDELDRMSRIVDDLLLLAKTEQPDFVRLEPVELSDLTTELLMKATALGERDWRLDACATGPIQADRQRLAQAMLNLARNAVEHTEPGAEIGLGSDRRNGEILLWVRDTGPGVDPAERDRIFERFARGHAGPRSSDGAGLGLAIARAVATAHNGRVQLDSRPGSGATFTLALADRSGPTADEPTSEFDLHREPTRPAGATDTTHERIDVTHADASARTRPPTDADQNKRTPPWPAS
jgi:two-component system OmpR family sensor kinase